MSPGPEGGRIRYGLVVAACAAGWVVPGAGHLVLGRRGRGVVYLCCILTLFILGVALESPLSLVFGFEDILASLFSVAQMGVGAAYFVARALGFEAGRITSPTYEYGNTFTAVAGLLNILVALDAFDIAVGRKK